MAKKVEWLGISETSADSIHLTIQKESGYDDTYWIEEDELRFLFSEAGQLLGRMKNGENDE